MIYGYQKIQNKKEINKKIFFFFYYDYQNLWQTILLRTTTDRSFSQVSKADLNFITPKWMKKHRILPLLWKTLLFCVAVIVTIDNKFSFNNNNFNNNSLLLFFFSIFFFKPLYCQQPTQCNIKLINEILRKRKETLNTLNSEQWTGRHNSKNK